MTVKFVVVKKEQHKKRYLSQSIVMIQGPGVVAPLVWTFASDVFC